jgi:MerR family transcriptional regulator, heat shock protein HspR
VAKAHDSREIKIMDAGVLEGFFAINAVVVRFDVTPETLVRYERAGLLHPRIINDVRFYSDADVGRLSTIRRLTDICGINLAGVDVVLRLLEEIQNLQSQRSAPTSQDSKSKL